MANETVTWDQPQEIDDVTLAFPANVCGTLLPSKDEIPKEFYSYHNNDWGKSVSTLFFKGGRLPLTKEGVDHKKAERHLYAVLRSFEPQHEHKIAGAAYLMSLWCKKP